MAWRDVVVELKTAAPCPLTGWSGSAAYRILLEIIRRAAEPKGRIFVHPLYSGGRPILSGVDGRAVVLEPNASVKIRAVMTEQDLYYLLSAISKGPTSSPCPMEAAAVEFSPLEAGLRDGHGFAVVKLRFYPTAFMFHGRDVLYPSPQRLAYSLAKAYKELFGADLKALADRASTALEVVGMWTKPVRVNIGDLRLVPAFLGKAELAVYGNVEAWLSLLRLGEAVGVGISRAIGFGKYKIEEISTHA